MNVLAVMMEDDREERLYRAYTADCIGALVRANGADKLPLYSDLIRPRPPRQSAREILDNVRKLFSGEVKK